MNDYHNFTISIQTVSKDEYWSKSNVQREETNTRNHEKQEASNISSYCKHLTQPNFYSSN